MDYYEYEYIVENLINILNEKKEAEENQYKEQNINPNNYTKGFKMPSMPKMGSIANFPGIPSSLKI